MTQGTWTPECEVLEAITKNGVPSVYAVAMTGRVPAPRFRPVSRESRGFVDREEAVLAFEDILERIGQAPTILNITGVGGIGKSRLLREMARKLATQRIVGWLDLERPPLSQPDAALLTLRAQLVSQRVNFGDFDLAYAIWWQRTNPHRRLERSQLPLIEESEVLSGLIDSISGVPLVGTAFNLLRVADRLGGSTRRWVRIKRRDVLRTLDERPVDELIDALTFFFAEAVRTSVEEQSRPFVLLVDGYEALDPHSRSRAYRATDGFLRDLGAQLSGSLVGVASREPLRWEESDSDWMELVQYLPLDVLPFNARLELLQLGGIEDVEVRQMLAEASDGLPFYLHLAVDHFEQGKDLKGATTQREILDLFLEHVNRDVLGILRVVAQLRVIHDTAVVHVLEQLDVSDATSRWPQIKQYSFFTPSSDNTVAMHRLMVSAISGEVSENETVRIHRAATQVWRQLSRESMSDLSDLACREFLYHKSRAGELDARSIFATADELQHTGRLSVLDGIVHDLDEADASHSSDAAVATAARCVDAELAILQGAPERSTALLALQYRRDPTTDDERLAVDRLLLAGAHGLRITGSTEEAYETYGSLMDSIASTVAHGAMLWRADIDMARGRFKSALEICKELEQAAAGDLKTVADTHRLRYLAYRWSFLFDDARRALKSAEEAYGAAAFQLGLANVRTNAVELSAWTDPGDCLRRADATLHEQRGLGALHEVGKTMTAVALAHLLQRDLDAADLAAREAISILEKAQYRSGRARAMLVRAYVSARRGHEAPAITFASSSAGELAAAKVYPTLIWLACLLVDDIGAGSSIEPWTRSLIDAIEPHDDVRLLRQRVMGVHERLTDV